MAYIFDTNIFIRSKNEMPMEVWPTFWRRMAEMIKSGQVYSSVEVKAKIDKGKDELTTWIHDNASDLFYYAIDDEVLAKMPIRRFGRKPILYSLKTHGKSLPKLPMLILWQRLPPRG